MTPHCNGRTTTNKPTSSPGGFHQRLAESAGAAKSHLLPNGHGDKALALSRPLILAPAAARGRRAPAWALAAVRATYIVGALLLFILALEALKKGAGGIVPILDNLSAQGSVNILGFGWLGAYLVLSGSPVAAIALSLFAGNALSDTEAFAMINGSRFGASFIVLLVGFLYYLGKRRTADGIFIGVVALLTTLTIYAPVVPLGSLALRQGWFDSIRLSTPAPITSFVDLTFDPAVGLAAAHLPRLLLFVGGVGLLLGSFQIFDRALPNLESVSGGRVERIARLLHHPLVMFALGLLVTLMTLSVSLSITLLIPLSLKGYVRRDGIIPYVMGANISTWVDTMAAALLLGAPRAFTVVFTEMALGAAISLPVLLFACRPYSRAILALAGRATHSKGAFLAFLVALFILPIIFFFS